MEMGKKIQAMNLATAMESGPASATAFGMFDATYCHAGNLDAGKLPLHYAMYGAAARRPGQRRHQPDWRGRTGVAKSTSR